VFTPAKTPTAIVDRLHREIQNAMQLEAVKARLAELGVDPMDLSPAQFERAGREGDRDQRRAGQGGRLQTELIPITGGTHEDMRLIALAALGTFIIVAPAAAQDKYPVKPVKIVVPYGPGGATDIVARIVAEQMRPSLGQSLWSRTSPARSASWRSRK
jgi:tripartite-type tricarboxylate transporter receptor subunit TctC